MADECPHPARAGRAIYRRGERPNRTMQAVGMACLDCGALFTLDEWGALPDVAERDAEPGALSRCPGCGEISLGHSVEQAKACAKRYTVEKQERGSS